MMTTLEDKRRIETARTWLVSLDGAPLGAVQRMIQNSDIAEGMSNGALVDEAIAIMGEMRIDSREFAVFGEIVKRWIGDDDGKRDG